MSLICKNCLKEKDETEFSKHEACKSGYDISRCLECKRNKQKWADTPMINKIYNRAKNRAKSKGWEFNIELSDIVLPEVCPVFGKPIIYGNIDWTYSIDRTDSSKGYIKGNIDIISNKANRSKNSLTITEVEQVLKYMKGKL